MNTNIETYIFFIYFNHKIISITFFRIYSSINNCFLLEFLPNYFLDFSSCKYFVKYNKIYFLFTKYEIYQSFTVLSNEKETNSLPSGENITKQTSWVCPCKMCIYLPVLSQTFIV